MLEATRAELGVGRAQGQLPLALLTAIAYSGYEMAAEIMACGVIYPSGNMSV